MKSRSKLFRLALLAPALSLLLALPTPRRSDARQSEGLARGAVGVRVEGGKELKLYEKSYALIVGVSDYTAGWPKLPGVKKDVEEVARALERHGFLVTKVENPDSVQLEKSFKEFIETYGLGVESRLVFYFAGHGHTVRQSYGEEMGYIVPSDAPLPASDPAGFMSKAMDMHQMEVYAHRVQSKHALFLFDSCFSGAFFALSRAVPDSISYKTARPVRQFITSGSADEQVPDQSIFRRQFVEALEGEADVNKDGYVTGTELGEFLQDKVTNYSRNAQHPQYGKLRNPNLDKGDFVFALPKASKSPGVAKVNPPSPPPGGTEREPVDESLSYDGLTERARSALAEKDYDGGFRYAQQAVRLDPRKPDAYTIIGVIELYSRQNFEAAEVAMRTAIERGGAAAFRVQHDHSGGSFSTYCEGTLFVEKNGISFKADNGRDTFAAEDSNIRQAKLNTWVGPQFGAFSIQPVQQINGRANFNFAPGTRNKVESQLIIRLIDAY